MLYEKYQRKIEKISAIKKWLKRHRVILILTAAIVFTLLFSFLSTKGVIYYSVDMPSQINYGDDMPFRANAVFSPVTYEYANEDSEEWTTVMPIRKGNYLVRAKSTNIFGAPYYTKAKAFKILPKTIEVSVLEKPVLYGEKFELSANLMYKDSISCNNFEYAKLPMWKTQVTCDKDSIVITDENGNEVTDSYKINVVSSEVTLKKRALSVTVSDAKKVYDGTALSFGGYELTGGTLAEGDSLIATFDKKRVDAGETENTPKISIINSNGFNATDFYDIDITSGMLTVERRPIYIKTNSAEKIYDGAPLENFEHEISADTPLVSGNKLKIVGGSSQTDVGSCKNLVNVKITDGNKDVTDNYSLLFSEENELKVLARPLTIKTAEASKTYDGTPLKNENYSVESTLKPLSNHSLNLKFAGSQTKVGSSINLVKEVEIFEDEKNVSKNYSFKFIYGELKVVPTAILVRTATSEFIYNGKAQHDGSLELVRGALGQGDFISAGEITTLTDVGSVNNQNTAKITDSEGNDVSNCYEIKYEYGTLTIKKCKIEVTTETKNLYFNGEEQFASGHKITPLICEGQTSQAKEETLVKLNNVEVLLDGTYKKYQNKFELSIFSGERDVTFNYEISYIYGVISMLPKSLTVKTATTNFIYNGLDQFDTSVALSAQLSGVLSIRIVGDPPTLNEVERLSNGSYLQISNVFHIAIFRGDEDVTSSFIITYEYGKLSMLPRPINITTATNSWEYDGKPHFDGNRTADNLVQGHRVYTNTTLLKTVTDVIRLSDGTIGKISNEFSVEIFNIDKNVTKNYAISYTFGTISILPRKITITTNTNEWLFDGEVHFDKGFSITKGRLVNNHLADVLFYPTVLNVIWLEDGTIGSVENKLKLDILFETNSVLNNYDVNYIYGTIRVIPRRIEITTNSNEWIYDDLPHQDLGYSITSGSLLQNCSVVIVGDVLSIKNVGSKENIFKVEVVSNETNLSVNYEITYVYGTIKIIPRPITIKLIDRLKGYDGLPLISKDYNIESGSLVLGHWISIVCNGSQTEIGSSENTILTVNIFFADEDVSKNYAITKVDGILEVEKRSVYLRAGSASKIFDGKQLVCLEYSVQNLLSGHNLTAATQGSQTEVGISKNIILPNTIKITLNGKDVSSFYKVIVFEGELHVGLRKITVKTFSNEKKYDGTPLTDSRYEVIGELISDHIVQVSVIGARTQIGTSDNIAIVQVHDSLGKDVTYCYLIKFDFGKLTVTGNSDLNTDGSIDTNPSGGNPGDSIAFKATSDTTGKVYFRAKSFGDYTTLGWSNAAPYLNDTLNALKLMNLSLSFSGKKSSNVLIETITPNLSYMMPYYASNGYVTTDDTQIIYAYGNSYSISYIPYEYNHLDNYSLVNTSYKAFEKSYNDYVNNNYLQLPESTRTKLLEIALKNNLKAGSPTLINDVSRYVQNAVKYDLNFNPYYGDIALYFFTQAKTGICQHYATAATAMFRALNIPARYTIGYVGEMTAGMAVEVSGAQAHAWVEVYLPGSGWVQIEVTGAGAGSGNGSGDGLVDEDPEITDGEGEGKSKLTIKPVDVTKYYDGTPLNAKNEVEGYDLDTSLKLEQLLEKGYRYKVSVSGSRTDYGVSESTIESFVLYDSFNRNVSGKFTIEYKPGSIRITNLPIYIQLYALEKNYDGTPLSYESQDYWAENLPEGYRLEFDLKGSLTNAGMLKLSDFEKLPFKIYNTDGVDVTANYSLVFKGKPLRIYRRAIEITSISASKSYDGTPLKNDKTWISKGYFAPTHKYEVKVTGEITDIGSTKNTISSIRVLDDKGVNVTNNYTIKGIFGTLKIENA